jgi:Holliday junction resolvasome RuvABC ATP-dependent DNA helicase subunit
MDAPSVPAPGVYFKPGEPRTFAEYDGQHAVTAYLAAAVDGRRPTARDPEALAVPNQLFTGVPGLGKTLLAKVLAHELDRANRATGRPPVQFIECFPSDIPDLKALDRVMRRVQSAPGCVLFIDEVHDFTDKHVRKLYLVLEEGRYKFEDEPDPTLLPGFTLVAATTDPGKLDGAFKRRFDTWVLKPATADDLYGYVVARARGNGLDVDEDAVDLIVERTHYGGAPWEAVRLYEQAAVFARGDGDTRVRREHVETVCATQEIDELGLRWPERRVIAFLLTQPKTRVARGVEEFVCYAASEDNVCRAAGVDRAEYRDVVRPRLMARGLLTMHPRGQALTEFAVARYGGTAGGA